MEFEIGNWGFHLKGYTVIELIVAIFVFSLVVVSALDVAVSIVKMQRQTKAAQDMEDNARAIFETIVREVRTGTDFRPSGGGARDYLCFNAVGTSATPDPYFVRYYLDSEKIYRSVEPLPSSPPLPTCPNFNAMKSDCESSHATCSSINSDDVNINTLQFIEESGPNQQSMVTIFMQMSDEKNIANPINLQTTISSRQY